MVSFGETILLWRLFRGLTQEGLAKKARIPRPNLAAIENGKREASLATLRMLASALGVTPGVLADGIAPLHFKKSIFTRESLETIVEAALGKSRNRLTPQQKIISRMFSNIIRDRINAKRGIYKNTLLRHTKTFVANWLMLKAAIDTPTLNSLLARVDKHLETGGV